MESGDEQRNLEREPRPSPGLRAPLFERLTGSSPDSVASREPFRMQNTGEVVASVRREISRLLNTRVVPGHRASAARLSVVDYGIGDFSHISAADTLEVEALATRLTRAIHSFEPRLLNPRVILQADPSDPRKVIGQMEAKLMIGMIPEPVCFPLELYLRGNQTLLGDTDQAVLSYEAG
jgi:type VI secretion system lysozyme-like protein